MDFSLLFSSRWLRGLAPPKFSPNSHKWACQWATFNRTARTNIPVNSELQFLTFLCFNITVFISPQRCNQFCCTCFLAIRRYFKREPSNVTKPELDPNFKEFINKNDLDGSTALHLAVQTGRKEVSQVLIQYGADVNCQNKSLQTPVYLAAVGGHQDVLRMLISQGGDVNAKDSQERTALHR